MKFEKLRLIQDQIPRITGENMAIDEALLLTAESPVIRFYRWARPSVSFGYFAAWSEVYQQFPQGKAWSSASCDDPNFDWIPQPTLAK